MIYRTQSRCIVKLNYTRRNTPTGIQGIFKESRNMEEIVPKLTLRYPYSKLNSLNFQDVIRKSETIKCSALIIPLKIYHAFNSIRRSVQVAEYILGLYSNFKGPTDVCYGFFDLGGMEGFINTEHITEPMTFVRSMPSRTTALYASLYSCKNS